VDQVSVPVRIALVGLLAFAALWFVALKPRSSEERAAPPPVVGAADKARDAAATSDAANAGVQDATGEAPAAAGAAPASASAKAAPVQAGAPGAAKADAAKAPAAGDDPSRPLLRALDRGRAVVLLFAGQGADDAAARRAVRGLSRRNGKVLVQVAPISRVGRYEAITMGVHVAQAPTTVVIGPGRQAHAITGFTDVREVDQAVGDLLADKR